MPPSAGAGAADGADASGSKVLSTRNEALARVSPRSLSGYFGPNDSRTIPRFCLKDRGGAAVTPKLSTDDGDDVVGADVLSSFAIDVCMPAPLNDFPLFCITYKKAGRKRRNR